MNAYTIILADDHAMMRDGIRMIIDARKGLRVIGEADDGLGLLQMLKKMKPDMVILDISMPGMRGAKRPGKSATCIPKSICISVRTVQRHQADIRAKLHCQHTADLVRHALSEGLINHCC